MGPPAASPPATAAMEPQRGLRRRALLLPSTTMLLLGLLFPLLLPLLAHAGGAVHALSVPTARRRGRSAALVAGRARGLVGLVEGFEDAAAAPGAAGAAEQQGAAAAAALVVRRGGGGDSGSLLGRILRAWRGSATPVGRKGGVLGRLRRFVKALWTGKASGGAAGAGAGGRVKAAGGGGGKVGGVKAQGRIDKHLGKAYKRGNANFRIQKVGRSRSRWFLVGCVVVWMDGGRGGIFDPDKHDVAFDQSTVNTLLTSPPRIRLIQPPTHSEKKTGAPRLAGEPDGEHPGIFFCLFPACLVGVYLY